MSHLQGLEAASIHVIREIAAERERPVLLFSGGKDSLVLLHLCVKAFAPAPIPFPLLHVDTGHNFPEVIALRDQRVRELGLRLVVASVEESIRAGRVEEEVGPYASRNRLQTFTLLDALRQHKFDAAFGGARRDEERARAKERVVSHRDAFGQWDPKNQRPELWNLYNSGLRMGEQVRVFPLSDWTELDIWLYIRSQQLALPSLYFAHERRVIERDGMLLAVDPPFVPTLPSERPFVARVRFRTMGDVTCTGAVRSEASSLEDVIREVLTSRVTERGAGRLDDRANAAAMERRKREGYF
ncbi:MAG TPA: sulfate adenylyltransferase subunit CysD [Polyangiales bacterium]